MELPRARAERRVDLEISTSVSVVMPNYNHSAEITTALAAAVAQTRPADEILVIDDASTDASVDVIAEFMRRHSNIRLLRNERRLGVPRTVSRGITAARGEYVILAAADEMMRPNMIERLTETAARFPSAQLIVSSYTEWWPDRREIKIHGRDFERGVWYLPSDEPSCISAKRLHELLHESFVWLAASSAMYRRSALLEVGSLDPALEWHGDWFATYAIAFKYGFCAVPESLALFRVAKDSYFARGQRDPRAQREVALNILRKLHEERYSYFRKAVLRSPCVMSTFFRPLIVRLLAAPAFYSDLLPMLGWWLGEFLRGRRPGFLARLVHGGPPRPVLR